MGFVGRVKDSVLALFGYPTQQRPEQQMDSMIASMSVNLRKCKGQVAIVLASQKRLQEQLHQNMNMVTQYQVKALAAVGRGEEELARELLRKKRRYEQTVEDLKVQLGKHKNISDSLMETVRKLELKLEETKRSKLLLLTQKQTYETSRLIEEGMDGVDGEFGFQEILENLEDDVNSLKYSTQIGLDVEAERLEIEGDEDEEPLALPDLEIEQEVHQATIDDELDELRDKLASGELEALDADSGDRVIHMIEEDEEEDGGIQILSTEGVDEATAARRPPPHRPSPPARAAEPQEDEGPEEDEDVAYENPDDPDPDADAEYEAHLRAEAEAELAAEGIADHEEDDEDGAEDQEEPPPPPEKKAARRKGGGAKGARKKPRKAPPPEAEPEEDDEDDDGIVFLT